MTTSRTAHFRAALLSAALLGAAALPSPAAAQKLCVPLNTWTGAPTVNGTIDQDSGWAGAGRYVFANGTAQYDGAIDLIRDASNLYFGFEMYNDTVDGNGIAVDKFDTIVVAFDVPGADPEYRLIVLQPRGGGTVIKPPPDHNGTVNYLQFATATALDGTGHIQQWNTAVTPAGAQAQFTSGGPSGSSSGQWQVELVVPLAALNLPASGDFGLYVDGMRADQAQQSLAALVWPSTAAAVGNPPVVGGGGGGGGNTAVDVLVGSDYPKPADWGKANLGGSGCTGIYFAGGLDYDPTDVYVNTPGNSTIGLTAPNQFFAQLHNSGPEVNGIIARFKVSNTGISGSWDDVPYTQTQSLPGNAYGPFDVKSDPTGGLAQSGIIQASDWTGGTAQYKGAHVCMLVELDVKSGLNQQVNFLNKSAIQNMNWGQTSTFSQKPLIDASGWKPLPGEDKVHLQLNVVTRAQAGFSNGLTGVPRGSVVGQIEWAVHGYLPTGQLLNIGNQTFRVQRPIGGFEYVLHHAFNLKLPLPESARSREAIPRNRTTAADVPPLLAGGRVDPGLLPIGKVGGLPSVLTTDWNLSIGGANRSEGGNTYTLDLVPGEKVELTAVAESLMENGGGCGCHRMPLPSLGLIALGLAALRMPWLRRRRK
jgi:hypothetical protein